MYPDFLVDDNLTSVCGKHLKNVIDYFDDLKTINSELENLLQDKSWTGDTKTKCAAAVQMMEDYRDDLDEIAKDIKKYMGDVVYNANDFVNQSDKVASIRKV